MQKLLVKYNDLKSNWLFFLNQFQSLSMALEDLKRLESGKKLYYIFDGYDFCHWFYKKEIRAGVSNPHHEIIRDTWEKFFTLTDGTSTCAVMSPFTIIEFLQTISIQLDNTGIIERINRNPEIKSLLDAILHEEKNFESLPGHQQTVIQNLYTQILQNKSALEFFSQSGPFSQLQNLFDSNKIRFFDPLIPEAAQIIELFEYDQEKILNAINYLQNKRRERSSYGDIYNSLDVYHYILVENSRRSLNANSIIPYLTSSGILSRNSWYMLKYNSLPNLSESSIPIDWFVRTIEVPTILLSTLSYQKDTIENASTLR